MRNSGGPTTPIKLFLALVVVGLSWIVLPAASVGARSNASGGVVSESAPRTVHATATEHTPSPTTNERALQGRSWSDGLRSPRTPMDASAPVRTGRPQVPATRAMSTRAEGASGGSVGGTPSNLSILRSADLGGGTSTLVSEPSAASDGTNVLETWNWYAATSSDGGSTFSYIDPYSAFPSSWGGFCCDQIALHDPVDDLWIWTLMYNPDPQGSNGIRVAVANGASGLQSHTFSYFDVTPQAEGDPVGMSFDQPKLALTSSNLFLTVAEYNAKQVFVRTYVFRIPLSQLASGGPFTIGYFKTLVFSPAFAPGDPNTMYFAGHLSTSTLRLFTWPDSVDATGITSIRVTHSAYPAALTYACPRVGGPSTSNWCKRDDDRVMWGWVFGGVAGFVWDASQGTGGLGSFPYPYVHVVLVDLSTGTVDAEPIVWSNQMAFGYGVLAPVDTGTIGGTVLFGGGSTYESCGIVVPDPSGASTWALNPVIGAGSDTSQPEGGDYLTAHGRGSAWDATCYGLIGGGSDADVHPFYLSFETTTGGSNQLDVSVAGSGSVRSSPAGITCGASCSSAFAAGSTVNLTATPTPGWRFDAWGDACSGQSSPCSVVMDSAKTATATFSPLAPVRVSGALSGFFATTGGVHLYRFGRNVVYTGTVAPNRAGEPLWFQEQQKIAGVWKAAGAPFHYRLGANSKTGVEFVARYLKLRRPYRVRCYYLGDTATAPGSSSWSSFEEI